MSAIGLIAHDEREIITAAGPRYSRFFRVRVTVMRDDQSPAWSADDIEVHSIPPEGHDIQGLAGWPLLAASVLTMDGPGRQFSLSIRPTDVLAAEMA